MDQEGEKYIRDNVTVTRQRVAVAKAHILSSLSKKSESPRKIVDGFLHKMDAVMPKPVLLNQGVGPTPELKKAADSISWRLAAWEALWNLIHSGRVLQASDALMPDNIAVSWTRVSAHSSESSSWQFEEWSTQVPHFIIKSRLEAPDRHELLTDGDLYLQELDIPGIEEPVEEALREAVACFRHELYTASVAMLGKAAEGAWIALGLALLSVFREDSKGKIDNERSLLLGGEIGIRKKVDLVSKRSEHPTLQKLIKASGVFRQDIHCAALWADTVRDSRNVIHHGVEAAIPNSYEKVAALLLAAVPHLRVLYRVQAVANTQEESP